MSLTLLVFSVICISLSAQDKIPVLKGVVKNDAGERLVGATVFVQGTSNHAVTGKDGSFELHNVETGATLRISYVGHAATTIKVKRGDTDIAVKMVQSSNMMNEVVVNTGLYKRPAGNFTGAAKTYAGDDLKLLNPTNVLQALAMADPSVRIEQNNAMGSDPNSLPVIQLRGQNSLPVGTQGGTSDYYSSAVSSGDIMSSYLSNPNQPLIILDGFQTSLQTLYDMDINRIASITVLKDAAATTAYGAKAANGVIVVETKQPLPGRAQVSYAVNFNLQAPDLTSYHLMDAKQLLEAQRLAGVYSDPNNGHYNNVALNQWYDQRLQQVQSGVNTYWLSQPVRTGFGTSHSLNVSGGTRAIRYSLALNYNNGVGVMKGSGRDNFGLSYALSYNGKKIRLSNSTSIGYNKANNSPWGSFNQYASQFPYFKPYDSAGNVIKVFEPSAATLGIGLNAPGGTFTNAAYNSTLNVKDYSYYYSLTNNTNLEWTINSNFKFRAAVSYSANTPGAEQFLPADHTSFVNALTAGLGTMGSYTRTRGNNNVLDGKLNLDYYKKINAHTFFAAVGTEVQGTSTNATTIKVTGIPNEYLGELGMANGYGLAQKPQSNQGITRTISSFASFSYNYAERYTAEVTGNVSGSSLFGANQRFAPFWAGGIGWNVDKEKFFVSNPIIQQLRFRLSTGVTGNQNFAALGQSIYQYNNQNSYRLQLGATAPSYANPDLKYQQTLKNNLGVAIILLNGRLNVSADVFRETTNNLILPLDVAPSTGFLQYQDNLGATKNSGYEVTVSAPIIRDRKRNIFWSLSFNVGSAKNVITALSPAVDAINATYDTAGTKQLQALPKYVVGRSLSQIWAVQSLGIDPATGKELFQKLDGSKTFLWDVKDKQPIGDAAPKLKGGFGSNFTYKGFSLNINMSFQWGGQMYNQTLVDKVENVDLRSANADERVITQRWKQPGDKVPFKALVVNGTNTLQATYATSRFVQDNNFLDASSLTVAYQFSPNLWWVRKLRLSTPRLAVTQNNAFHLGTIKTERGTAYPFARSFSFGLSTTF
ncbi:SusC/RagA family TonB-linked outer membrane protein [Pinibacter soli]|uniref:SusC/RagA family TonB-linked outer membrane protein n=1 Tax=Pinibacter soli TaxID=3044211 RepID=A0ABT6RG01_9BACT|nr:SusC/RagA family TonB-linked outer membrane protein [Pinibacter soli]MDI3321483.1 SusC/RagA family TonB-linked outer membrane protein [Pinibacter soli]